MKNRARNKTELAARLGYGRNTLYGFMRLPGFPEPDQAGCWNIAACRKFILRQAERVAGPVEKDRLGLRYLQLKCKRAEQELIEFETDLRSKIEAENLALHVLLLGATKIRLHQMIEHLG